MRTILFTLLLAELAFTGGVSSSNQDGESEVTMYYIPFTVATYVPVTTRSIEDKASCVLDLPRSSAAVVRLSEAIQAAKKGRFDDRVVRMKIVGMLPSEVFVDKDGGLLGVHEHARRMKRKDLADVRELMKEVAARHGCQVWPAR